MFKQVRLSDYYRNRIAKGLRDNIWETIFKPIFDILNSKQTVFNAKMSALMSAIDSGKVYYENGAFKAVKNYSNAVAAELEELGAQFKHGAYYLEASKIPVELDSIIKQVAVRDSLKISALNALLLNLSQNITKDEYNKIVIEHAAELMYKKLEKDLIESTSDKKVPTIGTYVEAPELEIADTKIDTIEKYWEKTDLEAEPLHFVWKSKDDEVKELESQLKEAQGPEEEKLQKQLDRAKTQRENARQRLADFRYSQQLNAPNIDLDTDITSPSEENPAAYEKDLEVFQQDNWTKKISKDYVYNMKFWVKKWKAQEIIKMRRKILEMAQAGVRTESIKQYIMKEWGIAERKAAFLARNESEIASSVLKAVHYQRMGCTHFFWIKSVSIEKRELHLEYTKEHNNKYGVGGRNIFAYDNPPIIDERTGQRGLPGQTYNCQCNQIGIKNPEIYAERRKRLENAKRNIFTKLAYRIKNSLQRDNYPWRYRRFGEGEAF